MVAVACKVGVIVVMSCVGEIDGMTVGVRVGLMLTSVGLIDTIVLLAGVCTMTGGVSVAEIGVSDMTAAVSVAEMGDCSVGVGVLGGDSVAVAEIGDSSSVVSMRAVSVGVIVCVLETPTAIVGDTALGVVIVVCVGNSISVGVGDTAVIGRDVAVGVTCIRVGSSVASASCGETGVIIPINIKNPIKMIRRYRAVNKFLTHYSI